MAKKLSNKKYLKHLQSNRKKAEKLVQEIEELTITYNSSEGESKKLWKKIEKKRTKLVNLGGSVRNIDGWIQETQAAIHRGEEYR